MITQEEIELVWNHATTVGDRDPKIWRHDPCGALIKKEDYGNRSSDFGWEVDHIVPRAFLLHAGASDSEIDAVDNLRVMHWANNDSKGTNYPEYKAVRKEENGRNKEIVSFYTVNSERQKQLKLMFSRFGI